LAFLVLLRFAILEPQVARYAHQPAQQIAPIAFMAMDYIIAKNASQLAREGPISIIIELAIIAQQIAMLALGT